MKLDIHSQIEDKDAYTKNQNRETTRKAFRKTLFVRKTKKKTKAVNTTSQSEFSDSFSDSSFLKQ